jgi:hypothetical protein
MVMERLSSIAALVLGVSLLTACSYGPEVGKLTPCSDEPEWVSRGGGEFDWQGGKDIVAVGAGAHEPKLDARLQKARADARSKLASQLGAYAAELADSLSQNLKMYFDPKATDAAGFFREAAKPVIEAALEGHNELAWWHCPVTQELFVLVRVPESQFLDAYKQQVHKFALERRERVFRQNTQEALKKFDQELDKLGARKARGYLQV